MLLSSTLQSQQCWRHLLLFRGWTGLRLFVRARWRGLLRSVCLLAAGTNDCQVFLCPCQSIRSPLTFTQSSGTFSMTDSSETEFHHSACWLVQFREVWRIRAMTLCFLRLLTLFFICCTALPVCPNVDCYSFSKWICNLRHFVMKSQWQAAEWNQAERRRQSLWRSPPHFTHSLHNAHTPLLIQPVC